MGEFIRNAGTLELCKARLEVELNAPLSKGTENTIHLQNHFFRLELEEREALMMLGAIIESERQFRYIKGL